MADRLSRGKFLSSKGSSKPLKWPKMPMPQVKKSEDTQHTIFYNGRNVTPKPLNPDVFTNIRDRHAFAPLDTLSTTSSEKLSTVRFYRMSIAEGAEDSGILNSDIKSTSSYLDLLDLFMTSRRDTLESSLSLGTIGTLPIDVEQVKKIEETTKTQPEHFSLKLQETNTLVLVDFTSTTVEQGTQEGDLVEKDNRVYEDLTVGRGRCRRVSIGIAQTMPSNKKTRSTLCDYEKNKTKSSQVNDTVMYKEYKTLDKMVRIEDESDEDLIAMSLQEETHPLNYITSEESFRVSSFDKQLARLMKLPRFVDAVIVMERILANNCFNEQQNIFRGLHEVPEREDDIEYKYSLRYLWTFANDNTEGRCVTCLEWSTANEDLLAVGYGRFYLEEGHTGIVMIWNVKNPVQPERTFKFTPPVNTLSFSKQDPNLLAVGFVDGSVVVINVVSREKQIIAQNIPFFEQVRHLSWAPGTEQKINKEVIYATGNDGRVTIYTIQDSAKLESQEIMRLAKADGKIKGYVPTKVCSDLYFPAYSYAAALFVTHHPNIPTLYFVGTNQGIVNKCSTNYLHQHLDLFCAHTGPINCMKFNPFSDHIFATCGEDWRVRIWAVDLTEPIHELFVTMNSVEDIDWSPTHPTILATISSNNIHLWDIQRKIYAPQSTIACPTKCRCSVVRFVPNGSCLVVGDVEGNVHVYHLEDMPFAPFFPRLQLYRALKRSLETTPEVWHKLWKVVEHHVKNKDKSDDDKEYTFTSFGKSETTLRVMDKKFD